MKKNGGTFKYWQLHILEDEPDTIKRLQEAQPKFKLDKLMVFTGTVEDDPTGRWEKGFHMRSSAILQYDEETGIVETSNTIYTLEGEGNNDCVPNLGPAVMNLFY